MAEEVKYFEKLKLELVETGVRIQAKSPMFYDFFAGVTPKTAAGKPTTYGGGDNLPTRIMHVPSGLFRSYTTTGGRKILFHSTDVNLFHEGCPNLSWLLSLDLGKGLDIVVRQPMSLNDFEDYFSECCTFIQEFYLRNMRRGSLAATFTSVEETGVEGE
jgi:hypothetical protein